MKQLPANFRPFFWDSNSDALSIKGNQTLIIERLAAFGDMPELAWLEKHYTTAEITDVITSSQSFPPNVAHYLSLRYHFPYHQSVSVKSKQPPAFTWY